MIKLLTFPSNAKNTKSNAKNTKLKINKDDCFIVDNDCSFISIIAQTSPQVFKLISLINGSFNRYSDEPLPINQFGELNVTLRELKKIYNVKLTPVDLEIKIIEK